MKHPVFNGIKDYDSGRIVYLAYPEYGYYSRIERQANGDYLMTGKFGMGHYFKEDTGKLYKIQDTNGNILELEYGPDGNLTTITDSVGRKTQFAYSNGQLTTVTDPTSRTYTLSYSATGKLEYVSFDAVSGVKWKFEHYTKTDPATGERINVLSKIYTPRGQAGGYCHELRYYPDNRFKSATDPYNYDRSVTYHDADDGTLVYYGKGVDIYSVRAKFRPRPTNLGAEQTFCEKMVEYDPIMGVALKVTDVIGDAESYFIERTFHLPCSFFFDAYPNVEVFKDKRENETQYNYKFEELAFGQGDFDRAEHVKDNVIEIHRPGTQSPIEYEHKEDGLNRIETMTDELGNKTTYGCDHRGNLESITYPLTDSENAIRSYTYDQYGRLETSTDPEGNTTEYKYNDPVTGLMTHIYRPDSKPEVFKYDGMGNLEERRLPEGGKTTYVLGDLYRVKQVIDPIDAITIYKYDANSNLEEVTDPRIRRTKYIFDKLDRLTRTENAAGDIAQNIHDPNGNVIESRDRRNKSIYLTYDALNRVKSERRGAEHTDWEYYPGGLPFKEKRIGQDETISTMYQYDVRGNLTKTMSYSGAAGPAGSTVSVDCYLHDDIDRVILTERREETFGAGDQVIESKFYSGSFYLYDARGRTESMTELTSDPRTDPLDPGSASNIVGYTTEFDHDKVGNCTSVTDPLGNTTRSYFNSNNRLWKRVGPLGEQLGEVTITDYDDNGNVRSVEVKNPAGSGFVTSELNTYDLANRLIMTTDALGNPTVNFYDENGNMIMRIDAELHVIEHHYDHLDRMDWMKEYLDPLASIPDPTGPLPIPAGDFLLTSYEYDEEGNRTAVVDPEENRYEYEHDGANRLIRAIYPDTENPEEWHYDSLGRLQYHIDCNIHRTDYEYDYRDRLTRETHSDGTIIERRYDAADNLTMIDDGTVRKEMSYNVLSQLENEEVYLEGLLHSKLSYTYDSVGNRKTMTGPDSQDQVLYDYYETNRLRSITLNGELMVGFGYYPGGQQEGVTRANGAHTSYSYYEDGRVKGIRTTSPTGDLLTGFHYNYNGIGNPTTVSLEHFKVRDEYGYDGVRRLTRESLSSTSFLNGVDWNSPTVPGYFARYEYDKAGNRTEKDTSREFVAYEYGPGNRLLKESILHKDVPIHVKNIEVDSIGSYTQHITRNSVPGMEWVSQPTPEDHWAALYFEQQAISQVRLSVPPGWGEFTFMIQYLDNGGWQDLDLSSASVTGAVLQGDGWLYGIYPEVMISFPPVTTGGIRYYQPAGGGPAYSPDVACLDDLRVYGSSEEEIFYSYDENGSTMGRNSSLGWGESFQYNCDKRLSGYEFFQDGQLRKSWSYLHSPAGERLAKINLLTGEVERFIYDGPDVLVDEKTTVGSLASTRIAYYVNGLGTDSKLVKIVPGTVDEKLWYLCDALGTMHKVIHDNCDTVNAYLNIAFSESLLSQEVYPERYAGLAQREMDGESGLQYTRGRMYDSRLGRFCSRDPVTINIPKEHYIYCSNIPTIMRDPTGSQTNSTGEEITDNQLTIAKYKLKLEKVREALQEKEEDTMGGLGFFEMFEQIEELRPFHERIGRMENVIAYYEVIDNYLHPKVRKHPEIKIRDALFINFMEQVTIRENRSTFLTVFAGGAVVAYEPAKDTIHFKTTIDDIPGSLLIDEYMHVVSDLSGAKLGEVIEHDVADYIDVMRLALDQLWFFKVYLKEYKENKEDQRTLGALREHQEAYRKYWDKARKLSTKYPIIKDGFLKFSAGIYVEEPPREAADF